MSTPIHRCVILVACTPDLHEATQAAVVAARSQIQADPELFDTLSLHGPIQVSKHGKVRLPIGKSDSKRLNAAFRGELSKLDLPENTLLELGLILVSGEKAVHVGSRIADLRRSVDLTTLHPILKAVTLDSITHDSNVEDIIPIETRMGTVRLDSTLVTAATKIRDETLNHDSASFDTALLTQIVPSVQVSEPTEEPEAVSSDPSESDASPENADVPQVSEHPIDPQPSPTLPLRLVLLVIDCSGAAAAPKLRSRLTQLAVQLDQGLAPTDDTFQSTTLAMAAGTTKGLYRTPTGTLNEGALPKPGSRAMDAAKTMQEAATLLERQIDRITRSQIPLLKPIVVFLLPNAALFGVIALTEYQRITAMAEVGWIVTDLNGPAPHDLVEPNRLVHDYDLAVDELLFQLNNTGNTASPDTSQSPGTEAAT